MRRFGALMRRCDELCDGSADGGFWANLKPLIYSTKCEVLNEALALHYPISIGKTIKVLTQVNTALSVRHKRNIIKTWMYLVPLDIL